MTGISSIVPNGSFLYPSRPSAGATAKETNSQANGAQATGAQDPLGPTEGNEGLDRVSISGRALAWNRASVEMRSEAVQKEKQENGENDENDDPGSGPKLPQDLGREEQIQLAELRRMDSMVRAHEMAHLGASGGHATSGARYEFTVGPDGKRYAIAGEVSIDTSPVRNNPQATAAKARTVRAAAMAPANPSGADRAVAAAAAQMEADAMRQIIEERRTEGEALQSNPFQPVKPEQIGHHLDTTI